VLTCSMEIIENLILPVTAEPFPNISMVICSLLQTVSTFCNVLSTGEYYMKHSYVHLVRIYRGMLSACISNYTEKCVSLTINHWYDISAWTSNLDLVLAQYPWESDADTHNSHHRSSLIRIMLYPTTVRYRKALTYSPQHLQDWLPDT
jgi:hypothetical protein